MANLQIKIDRIAIWREAQNLEEGDINVAKMPAGIKYLPKGSNVYKISTEPMFRYVKNYHVGDVKFSLFVRTFIDDETGIGAQLDQASTTITEEYARHIIADPDVMNFEYLDIFIEEGFEIPEGEIVENSTDEEIEETIKAIESEEKEEE